MGPHTHGYGQVRAEEVGVDEACCTGPRWSAALTALGLMGSHFSPADKVECLAACCAQLSQLTDPCDGSFVRLVALAVLRANPSQLHSQLEYIARFVHPDRLWSAEFGGSFSIVRAAMQYLSIQDPGSFNRRGNHERSLHVEFG
uniref:VPS9 domain-containing protein n=1 Tax=Haptolina ericina TaxID=156174 RepID=A0A7S3BZ56_9EUKA|mmetsp:Transcript_71277/g.158438  ORF Transcript_71277/g.158438 Transcript_71277/m.158438 type:complete len:144 (+) Transcript_71277:342-773(+)